MVVRRIDPFSLAKVAAMLYAMLGLVFGAIISVFSLAGAFAGGDSGPAMFNAMFSAGAIVVLPILYGCFGFVMMLLMAALYNVAAGIAGGVELDIR
jgi:hypothetical protein